MFKILQYFSLFVSFAFAATSVVVADEQCAPTPKRSMGGNYVAGAATLQGDIGKGLVMRGRVLSSADCEPIAGAVIEHWQAGNTGYYEDHLRAIRHSAADGSYRFETEWPDMRFPHIHFIVTAENYEKLVTQWLPDEKTEKTEKAVFDFVLEPAF